MLVRHFWGSVNIYPGLTIMDRLMEKLRLLKVKVREWEKRQKLDQAYALEEIEVESDLIFLSNTDGLFPCEDKSHLKRSEGDKCDILRVEEEEWRLKSRALLIKCGDQNTKIFHNFANQRRIQNSIWDIRGLEGDMVTNQHDLSVAATGYFSGVFKDLGSSRIGDQLKVIQHFPCLFSTRDSHSIGRPVILGEI